MCFGCLCREVELEIGRRQASGACPHCGGKVVSIDVESHRSFFFLPVCFSVKRKYLCTLCSKRLVLTY